SSSIERLDSFLTNWPNRAAARRNKDATSVSGDRGGFPRWNFLAPKAGEIQVQRSSTNVDLPAPSPPTKAITAPPLARRIPSGGPISRVRILANARCPRLRTL